jgi:hypothetical protein
LEAQSGYTASYARDIDSILLSSLKTFIHHALSDAEVATRRADAAKAELDMYLSTLHSFGAGGTPSTVKRHSGASAAARGFAAHLSRVTVTATSSASSAAAAMSEAASTVGAAVGMPHATGSMVHVPDIPGLFPVGNAMMNAIGVLNPINALNKLPESLQFHKKSKSVMQEETNSSDSQKSIPATESTGGLQNSKLSEKLDPGSSSVQSAINLKDSAGIVSSEHQNSGSGDPTVQRSDPSIGSTLKKNTPLGKFQEDPHAQALFSRHMQMASAATSKATVLGTKCALDIPSQIQSVRRSVCFTAERAIELHSITPTGTSTEDIVLPLITGDKNKPNANSKLDPSRYPSLKRNESVKSRQQAR